MKTPIMTDSKPETIGSKVIDQTADTLGSQINISIFLGLLILGVVTFSRTWAFVREVDGERRAVPDAPLASAFLMRAN